VPVAVPFSIDSISAEVLSVGTVFHTGKDLPTLLNTQIPYAEAFTDGVTLIASLELGRYGLEKGRNSFGSIRQ
jgi:hypothetical protein